MAIRLGGVEFFVRANISQSVSAFNSLGRAGKGLQNNLRQTKTLFGGLGNQISAVIPILGGVASAFAGLDLIGKAQEYTLLAARVENLGTVLNNVGKIAGLNTAQIKNIEDSVRSLGITAKSARQSLTQLAQANLDLRKAAQLTRIAQDAAVIAGIDSSEAFNRLVVSIQRNDVRLLRNLGIVINLNAVYRKFAQETGRVAASLTAYEKRNLLLNEVVQRGALIQGTYEASLGDVYKRLTSMNRLIEEAARKFGKQFIPVLEVVVDRTSDWLKAFEKGESQIGPRFIATLGTAVVSLSAFTASLGLAAGAFKLLGVAAASAGGPLTIALTAIGILVAGGAALWVDYKLRLAEVEAQLKTTGEEAEATTQKIFEANKVLDELSKFGEGIGRTADETERLRVEGEKLAVAFPDLADDIRKAVDAESAEQLVSVFRDKLPEALETSAQRIAKFDEQRRIAVREIRREVLQVAEAEEVVRKANEQAGGVYPGAGGASDAATAAMAAEMERRRELEASIRVEQRFNDLLKDGAEDFVRSNAEILENNESLRMWANSLLEAERSIVALRQAKLSSIFQEFQAGIKQLEQGANQATQIIERLENEKLRLYKDTNVKRVDEFERAQDELLATEIRTSEQLIETREAFENQALAAAKLVRDDQLKESERRARMDTRGVLAFRANEERKAAIMLQFHREEQRIAEASRLLVEQGEENLEKNLVARKLTVENITIALDKQEEATRRMLETAQFEADGVDPKLITIRRKLAEETEKLVGVNIHLDTRLAEVESRLEALAPGLASSLRGLTTIPEALGKNLTGPIGQLATRLIALNRAMEANRSELLANEKKFNTEFEQERQRLLDKLLEDQEKYNKKILELTDPEKAQRSTLEGLKALNQDIEKSGDDLDEFFRDLSRKASIAESDLTRGLFSVFDEFAEQLPKTLSTVDISILSDAFKEKLKDIEAASRSSVAAVKKELREFRETGRGEQERDNRIENQKRFNQLIDAGVPVYKARQEIARAEAEQRNALDAKEKEILSRVKQEQQERKAFLEERNQLEHSFAVLQEEQVAKAKERLQIQKEYNIAKEREVALQQSLLEKSKEQESTIRAFEIRPGAGGAPPGPSRNVSPDVKQLDRDVSKAGEIEVKTSRSIQQLIDSVRNLVGVRSETGADVTKAVDELVQQIEGINAEAKRGSQSFRSLRMIRKK